MNDTHCTMYYIRYHVPCTIYHILHIPYTIYHVSCTACPYSFTISIFISISISRGFLELSGAKSYQPTDMEISGANLIFLGWETAVYLLAAIALDYAYNTPALQQACGRVTVPDDTTQALRDEDVLAEEERVRSGTAVDSSVVLMQDMKKVGLSLPFPSLLSSDSEAINTKKSITT